LSLLAIESRYKSFAFAAQNNHDKHFDFHYRFQAGIIDFHNFHNAASSAFHQYPHTLELGSGLLGQTFNFKKEMQEYQTG